MKIANFEIGYARTRLWGVGLDMRDASNNTLYNTKKEALAIKGYGRDDSPWHVYQIDILIPIQDFKEIT